MTGLRTALLYTAVLMGANAAAGVATAQDMAALDAARTGDMKKLVLGDPTPVSDATFTDPEGGEHSLADWAGKPILLNFWATWCAPCREEMPALDALNAERGGEAFEVVTVATGRNDVAGIRRFFEEEGVETLPILLDPRSALARDFAVLGLPISILIDAEGNEIARLIGDADWASDDARAVVDALTATPEG